jgi:hypothetical protein
LKLKIHLFITLQLIALSINAQTDIDGLWMQKNYFCSGVVASKSSFDHYWEGNLRRDNLNMGTISYSSVSIMGNYGITDKLNFIFSVPYISTNASAGNLQGQKGIQDLSLWLKYAFYQSSLFKGDFQMIAAGGYSHPLTNYLSDILPLSIGLHSKVSSARLIIDYERDHYYVTASGTYMQRQNIFLDRNTYYTTQLHYTNEVEMPDATLFNLRTGYRNETIICDIFYEYFNTLGGFDIARNAMPFASNKMEAHKLGLYLKYETPVDGLSILGNCFTTFAGRNMGQSNGISLGAFYIIDFNSKKK